MSNDELMAFTIESLTAENDSLRAQLEQSLAEVAQDAARYQWLRTRAGQIGQMLWRAAPWVHEDHAANKDRLDLCIDEERVSALHSTPSKEQQQ